jgi:hypothetical protein
MVRRYKREALKDYAENRIRRYADGTPYEFEPADELRSLLAHLLSTKHGVLAMRAADRRSLKRQRLNRSDRGWSETYLHTMYARKQRAHH